MAIFRRRFFGALLGAFGAGVALPARPLHAMSECERFRDALERIALLDEADGHFLKVDDAFTAVGIASRTLGKHPSLILVDREARLKAR